jgi:hypothetical protein
MVIILPLRTLSGFYNPFKVCVARCRIMLALLTWSLILLGVALVQSAPFVNTSRSASIYAAAKADGIDLTVLPFVTAALDSIESAYTALAVPPFSNASRIDVHGKSTWDPPLDLPLIDSTLSSCGAGVVPCTRSHDRAKPDSKLDSRNTV